MSGPDLALVIVLVAVLPSYALARSIRSRGRPPGDRVQRYGRTIVMVLVPLTALAALWMTWQRPAAALGLGAPGMSGWILVGVATTLIVALAILAPRAKRPRDGPRNAEAEAMMPVGARETGWFLAFAVSVGAGWEILYRGYLWWALTPLLGPVGATATMGISYGVAHGFRGVGPLVSSIAAALLFAVAYAISLSLWWLIVIHIGLPLVGLRLRTRAVP